MEFLNTIKDMGRRAQAFKVLNTMLTTIKQCPQCIPAIQAWHQRAHAQGRRVQLAPQNVEEELSPHMCPRCLQVVRQAQGEILILLKGKAGGGK